MSIPLETKTVGNSIVQTVLHDDGRIEERQSRPVGSITMTVGGTVTHWARSTVNTTRTIKEPLG